MDGDVGGLQGVKKHETSYLWRKAELYHKDGWDVGAAWRGYVPGRYFFAASHHDRADGRDIRFDDVFDERVEPTSADDERRLGNGLVVFVTEFESKESVGVTM